MRTIATWLGRAVVASVIAALFLLLVSKTMLGWEVAGVRSGSMQPTYGVGSLVAIAPVDTAALRAGDVITYHRDGTGPLVTHRIVEVSGIGSERTFVTKGDANRVADLTPVPSGAIAGRVEFGVPLLGYLTLALRQPACYLGAIAAHVVAFVGCDLRSRRRRQVLSTCA
jgi:signal peptidase